MVKEEIDVYTIQDRIIVKKYSEGKHSRSSNTINLTEDQVDLLIKKLVAI